MIPIERKKSTHVIKMYIVDAKLSSPVIMGTASLAELKICLYDEHNNTKVRMQTYRVEPNEIVVENLQVNNMIAFTPAQHILKPKAYNLVKITTTFTSNNMEWVTDICT